MSLTTVQTSATTTQSIGTPLSREERRARRRAKITAQVHVRSMNSEEPFEEVAKSVDVSRDGLLFVGRYKGYEKGQLLEVAFPYNNVKGAENQRQTAEVVRVIELPHGKASIAVHFCAAKIAAQAAKPAAKVTQSPDVLSEMMTKDFAERQTQSIVLAVEPDEKGAAMMRSLLEPDGYTLVIVPTAKAALEYMGNNVPDVFLAEVECEDMSGHDLCVIIKQNERLSRVPVILTTRAAKPADYTASHSLGAVVCMAKPFIPERLQQVIRLVAPPPAQQSLYGSRISASAAVTTLA
jgi:CheY-like chemotaxis protein